VARLEKAKDTEAKGENAGPWPSPFPVVSWRTSLSLPVVLSRCVTAELKDSYEATLTDLRTQLKSRADKLNGMMESAAQSAAQIDDLKAQLEAARVDIAELEELRELKTDIERKEKQQAAIIEHQVSPT